LPLNLPNILTWTRILAIPLFVGIFYLPESQISATQKNLLATLIFALAAVTDWMDGYLARVLEQTSKFGAFLDPVADKLMVVAALVVLVQLERVDAFIAFIIVGREIAISALREWMAQLGKSKSVAVSFIGKVKTGSQMAAILLLLFHDRIAGEISAHVVGTWLIYLAAALTLWSMVYYLRLALPIAVAKDEPPSLTKGSRKI
jgi:cardiolipin synthase (CMP-forming)